MVGGVAKGLNELRFSAGVRIENGADECFVCYLFAWFNKAVGVVDIIAVQRIIVRCAREPKAD